MNARLHKTLTRIVVGVMLTWFFGGILLYSDAPIHLCNPRANYLYTVHPDGYCGKQGQPHTALDFQRFTLWQDVLFWLWPLGMCALIILRSREPKK